MKASSIVARLWRAKNPGKVRAATLRWRAKNRARYANYLRQWRAEHPDKVASNRLRSLTPDTMLSRIFQPICDWHGASTRTPLDELMEKEECAAGLF